jgi:hypothetical protein
MLGYIIGLSLSLLLLIPAAYFFDFYKQHLKQKSRKQTALKQTKHT